MQFLTISKPSGAVPPFEMVPALLEALEADPGEGGIAVHLPPRLDSEHAIQLLLAASQEASSLPGRLFWS